MNKLPHWLRWVLVIPLSVAAFCIVLIINAITSLGWFQYPVQLFNSWAGPIALVATAVWCAPKFKAVSGAVMGLLYASMLVLGIVIMFKHDNIKTFQFWWGIACGLIGIIVALCACFFLVDQRKKIEAGDPM